MKIELQAPSKLITEDHQVFILHAGVGRKFIDDFIIQSKVFLDYPNIDLRPGFSVEDNEIKSLLHKGRSFADYYGSGRVKESPPEDIADYDPKFGHESNKKVFDKKQITAVARLYGLAKKGA